MIQKRKFKTAQKGRTSRAVLVAKQGILKDFLQRKGPISKLGVSERMQQILQMRLDGLTYKEVGAELGMSGPGVRSSESVAHRIIGFLPPLPRRERPPPYRNVSEARIKSAIRLLEANGYVVTKSL